MEGDIGFNGITFITSIFYVIFIIFRVGLAIQGKGEGGRGALLFLLLYTVCQDIDKLHAHVTNVCRVVKTLHKLSINSGKKTDTASLLY